MSRPLIPKSIRRIAWAGCGPPVWAPMTASSRPQSRRRHGCGHGSGKPEVLIAGLAGLVAGAMSMMADEYASARSRTDAERTDLARETRELAEAPRGRARGTDPDPCRSRARPRPRGEGGHPSDRTRRPRLACARRTRHLGERDGPSDPGGTGVRAHLRRRCGNSLIISRLVPDPEITLPMTASTLLGGLNPRRAAPCPFAGPRGSGPGALWRRLPLPQLAQPPAWPHRPSQSAESCAGRPRSRPRPVPARVVPRSRAGQGGMRGPGLLRESEAGDRAVSRSRVVEFSSFRARPYRLP